MTIDEEPSEQEELASQAIVGMVVAAASVIEPHLSVALAGATPYLAEGLSQIFRRSIERQAQVIESASHESGTEAAELLSHLLSDPRGEQLLRHAMTAAREATVEDKIRVIAKALASGTLAEDDALIDTEILFLRAMVDIDIPHVQALRIFTTREAAFEAGHTGDPNDKTAITLKYSHLRKLLPYLSAALDPILATLEMHGLVTRTATGGGAALRGSEASLVWSVTDFGEGSLRRLEAWDTGQTGQAET